MTRSSGSLTQNIFQQPAPSFPQEISEKNFIDNFGLGLELMMAGI